MTRAIAAASTQLVRPDAVARLDEAAFSELYRKTSRPLWSYVFRVTGNAAVGMAVLVVDLPHNTFARPVVAVGRGSDSVLAAGGR